MQLSLPAVMGRDTPMLETRTVQLSVRLPRDIAAEAEEVQKTDPDFLSRVVLYGLTRRSIYRHLRDQGTAGGDTEGRGAPSPVP